jgi:hypothetical protein
MSDKIRPAGKQLCICFGINLSEYPISRKTALHMFLNQLAGIPNKQKISRKYTAGCINRIAKDSIE